MTISDFPKTSSISVVIVTRNHEATIAFTLRSLRDQTAKPRRVVVVDSGSQDLSWVTEFEGFEWFVFVSCPRNVGFCKGNNIGWQALRSEAAAVLFLNPDVILPERVLECIEEKWSGQTHVAALSIRLDKWDVSTSRPLPVIDSTGIFPGVWGWRDRRDNSPSEGDWLEPVPAICGAFFLAPLSVFMAVELSPGVLWDERYFAYKEDIELSLRLRRSGFLVHVWHGAKAWHARGWNLRRSNMSRFVRLLSARNQIRIDLEYFPLRLPISVLKWSLVKLLNL